MSATEDPRLAKLTGICLGLPEATHTDSEGRQRRFEDARNMLQGVRNALRVMPEHAKG